jgi:hypothetical protein
MGGREGWDCERRLGGSLVNEVAHFGGYQLDRDGMGGFGVRI